MPKTKNKTKIANLLTVGQMIDTAFGASDGNRVNFKMLQVVLVLLARQLRLLNRQVAVESDSPISISDTNIVVSEIKIKDPSKKKKAIDRAAVSKSNHTYKSDTRTKSDKSTITTLEDNLPKKQSLREFEIPSTSVWSSDANLSHLPPVLERASSIRSDTTSRNEKYYQLLEKIEEQREKVLRVIHQRKNSYDAGVLSPSPMTSMASTEMEFERLLIVENLPEARETHKCLAFVTRDVFDELEKKVDDLEKLLSIDKSNPDDFPETMKLMQELRGGSSFKEAKAALQMSTRLEAAEKVLQRLATLLGDPGLDVSHGEFCIKKMLASLEINDGQLKREYSLLNPEKHDVPQKSQTLPSISTKAVSDQIMEQDAHMSNLYVTKEEFRAALEDKQAEITRKINSMISNMHNTVETNTKQALKLETKLGGALDIKEKFEEMERTIISHSHQLNIIDTGLSSQMTNLQEQLTLVQLDLETALQNMTETLANKGVDNEMLSELNANYTHLQTDIEKSGAMQRNLIETQRKFAFDIERLKYDMELLRDIKCDRDEVVDALHDKAGVKDLNGMLSNEQFEAAYYHLQVKINEAQNIFKKQEIAWQQVIEDIFTHIDKKVYIHHVDSLRDDIGDQLNKLKRDIVSIKELLGEPLAASITRRIYRDTSCLSCANPAHIIPLQDNVPILPPLRPSAVGAEAERFKPQEDGDHSHIQCITGINIKHPTDSRAEICTRYCGGAHTKKRGLSRRPRTLREERNPLVDSVIVESFGTDGKVYQVEEKVILKPCIPCNQQQSEPEKVSVHEDESIMASINLITRPYRTSGSGSVLVARSNASS